MPLLACACLPLAVMLSGNALVPEASVRAAATEKTLARDAPARPDTDRPEPAKANTPLRDAARDLQLERLEWRLGSDTLETGRVERSRFR